MARLLKILLKINQWGCLSIGQLFLIVATVGVAREIPHESLGAGRISMIWWVTVAIAAIAFGLQRSLASTKYQFRYVTVCKALAIDLVALAAGLQWPTYMPLIALCYFATFYAMFWPYIFRDLNPTKSAAFTARRGS